MTESKIAALEEVAEKVKKLKAEHAELTVVHAHGVFDLLHIGHIRYLEKARRMGDRLVVTLTPDRHVNKGPHRPAFNETLRAEALAALAFVDYVAVNKWSTAVETIALIKPDIYVKGAEFRGKPTEALLKEQAAVEAVGGELRLIEDVTSSSSHLINRYLDILSEETRKFLNSFGERFTVEQILSYVDGLKPLKVLVVGDAIVDRYVYCEVIGKATKDPALVGRRLSENVFAGGALAVSNHVAEFGRAVELVSVLGAKDSYREFMESKLRGNVRRTFLYKDAAPTTVKTRYVEDYTQYKLFETYIIDDRDLNESEDGQLCAALESALADCDLAVVSDFGHGMLSARAIEMLGQSKAFLSINTQANAGNRGYNSVLKYPRADYVCLNESEFRLELRDRYGQLEGMVQEVSERLGGAVVTSTMGKYGLLSYSAAEGFCNTPAFATKVVDRIGAGDAVFALTSLLVAHEVPLEVVGFLGNAIGAEAVTILGNEKAVGRDALSRLVTSLLK